MTLLFNPRTQKHPGRAPVSYTINIVSVTQNQKDVPDSGQLFQTASPVLTGLVKQGQLL